MKKSVNDCPLCSDHNTQEYSQDKLRSYLICSKCELIFVPRHQLISIEDERIRYEHHENESEDPAYLNYLSKIEQESALHLSKGDEGLDFGCGPSPLLGTIFSKNGFPTTSYDLFFHANNDYQNKTYNFIILSEVIEHLRSPIEVMLKLRSLLKPQGKIFIKTKFYPEKNLFNDWFYKRDVTHVQFFNQTSLKFLATELQMTMVEKIGSDLYLLRD